MLRTQPQGQGQESEDDTVTADTHNWDGDLLLLHYLLTVLSQDLRCRLTVRASVEGQQLPLMQPMHAGDLLTSVMVAAHVLHHVQHKRGHLGG